MDQASHSTPSSLDLLLCKSTKYYAITWFYLTHSNSSGYYIWNIFLQMDSDRYPLRDYAAVFFRVFGPLARHGVNVLQSIQMILTVSTIILGQGQAIAQVSQGTPHPVCFVVCLLIFALIGMVLGQIRTLQRFGWLANFAVWINLLSIFIWCVYFHCIRLM